MSRKSWCAAENFELLEQFFPERLGQFHWHRWMRDDKGNVAPCFKTNQIKYWRIYVDGKHVAVWVTIGYWLFVLSNAIVVYECLTCILNTVDCMIFFVDWLSVCMIFWSLCYVVYCEHAFIHNKCLKWFLNSTLWLFTCADEWVNEREGKLMFYILSTITVLSGRTSESKYVIWCFTPDDDVELNVLGCRLTY